MVAGDLRVLFLGKRADLSCQQARSWCEQHFGEVLYFDGDWGDLLPDAARQWHGDLIVSYLCRWVVPTKLLTQARIAALNFHPATPEYPGIGCNNFALYDNAPTYGATCHHMAAQVDAGRIIRVTRFPMVADETVESLLTHTYEVMATLFIDVMTQFESTGNFPESNEQWTRPPITRAQFEDLRRIRPDMSAQEVARRVRATHYPPWEPYVELHGYKFNLIQTS